MAMVRATCVDGPREGAIVWIADGADTWTSSGVLGYRHYRVAGLMGAGAADSVVRLEYVGRSRSRVWAPTVPAVPRQRTASPVGVGSLSAA